jgi:hypothetical protein
MEGIRMVELKPRKVYVCPKRGIFVEPSKDCCFCVYYATSDRVDGELVVYCKYPEQESSRRKQQVKAVKFQIRPCGYKDQYNCIFITCEDGTEVVIPEKMVSKILEAWKQI